MNGDRRLLKNVTIVTTQLIVLSVMCDHAYLLIRIDFSEVFFIPFPLDFSGEDKERFDGAFHRPTREKPGRKR